MNMEPANTYTMERLVTDTEVDFKRRLRLSAMFGYFQDIAAFHAASLGASVERLYTELNVAWILLKVRVEVDEYPTLADELYVDTWPQAPRALYERDYTIRRRSGEVQVRAASTWVIMNLGTREIKRDKFLDYHNLEMRKDRAVEKGAGRQRRVEEALPVYEKYIEFSDVDYNSHVNNAKYIDYIMDAIPFDEHRQKEIRALEVYYVNELSPESELVIAKKTMDADEQNGRERLYIEGVRKSDEALVFYAVVERE
jgi:acyl-ACP thioesterase